jgi:hypothetical protein
VQVEQAFQSVQQSQLLLIQARSALETSLDAYKVSMGLPPDVKVKIDDGLLQPFQLVSPGLEKLQGELDTFFAGYRELDEAPSLDSLHSGYEKLRAYLRRLTQLAEQVAGELRSWKQQTKEAKEEDTAQRRRDLSTQAALEQQLPEIFAELAKLAKDLERERAGLAEPTRPQGWASLQRRARQLIADAAQLYVVQTQVRVYLIRLEPIPYTWDEAWAYAQANRLDLMNQRAAVVDAWRKIAVAATALKTGLDLKVTANVATPPDSTNPVDFRASASQYTVGLTLDTPLDRMVAMNARRDCS